MMGLAHAKGGREYESPSRGFSAKKDANGVRRPANGDMPDKDISEDTEEMGKKPSAPQETPDKNEDIEDADDDDGEELEDGA